LVQFAEEGSESFPLEVIHGGFFVGSGCNRAYVDGTKVFYDDCDCDSWSALWLEDLIEDLGYETAGRIDVYWLLPGMQIDALSMVSKVKEGRSTIVQVVDVQGTESSVAAQAQTKMLPMKMMGTVVVIVIQIIFRISLTVTMI
jgi:hypothetical protein